MPACLVEHWPASLHIYNSIFGLIQNTNGVYIYIYICWVFCNMETRHYNKHEQLNIIHIKVVRIWLIIQTLNNNNNSNKSD